MWQVTLHSSVMGFPLRAILDFNFFNLYVLCNIWLLDIALLVYCISDCPAVIEHENEEAPRKKKTRQKDKEMNPR